MLVPFDDSMMEQKCLHDKTELLTMFSKGIKHNAFSIETFDRVNLT